MGFRDVALLSCRASFYTFLGNCAKDEKALAPLHCDTLVGGQQGHFPCEILSLHQIPFLCPSNVIEITKLARR